MAVINNDKRGGVSIRRTDRSDYDSFHYKLYVYNYQIEPEC